jgi:branched-subunit amino acid aminotransferase/4-amino-4-deoxychorismate lyase
LFIVTKEGVIRTPGKNILEGITRKKILSMSSEKYSIEVGQVTLDDIRRASEVFLTSTVNRAMPIIQVDNTMIGSGKPGPVTEEMFKDLVALEEAEIRQAKIKTPH